MLALEPYPALDQLHPTKRTQQWAKHKMHSSEDLLSYFSGIQQYLGPKRPGTLKGMSGKSPLCSQWTELSGVQPWVNVGSCHSSSSICCTVFQKIAQTETTNSSCLGYLFLPQAIGQLFYHMLQFIGDFTLEANNVGEIINCLYGKSGGSENPLSNLSLDLNSLPKEMSSGSPTKEYSQTQ